MDKAQERVYRRAVDAKESMFRDGDLNNKAFNRLSTIGETLAFHVVVCPDPKACGSMQSQMKEYGEALGAFEIAMTDYYNSAKAFVDGCKHYHGEMVIAYKPE